MIQNLEIGGTVIPPGTKRTIQLHIARLYDYTELTLPVQVIRGDEDGPTMFVSGAIHGDEIIGTAIIKRVLQNRRMKNLRGTLIAVPIVNVFGFNNGSRYLPDRRDLNRSFPGAPGGSLASRIAHLFLNEVVAKCQYGIDFHSAAVHRANLPQIRTTLDTDDDRLLAEAFGAPVILTSKFREGSLRQAAHELGVKTVIFEGGEALRINESYVKHAVAGTLAVMETIGMLKPLREKVARNFYIARSSYWVRAPQSGMLRYRKHLGQKVERGSVLATVTDAFGDNKQSVLARSEGIIVGMTQMPLVNKGDALFHVATFAEDSDVNDLEDDLLDETDYRHPSF